MKIIVALLLLFVGFTSQVGQSDEPPVMLILGDSLSAAHGMDRVAGWVHLLELRLRENNATYRVLNSSISGDTTAGGLSRIARLLEHYHPAIVMIELGANDGLRGIEPGIIRNNLTSLVQQSKASGARVVLMGIKLPPNYGPAYNTQFESMYTDIAREYETLLVPFFMDGVVFRPELLQADRLHPNEKGQLQLLENVWKVLQAVLTADPEDG